MLRAFYVGEALDAAIKDFIDSYEERRFMRWSWLGFKPKYLWNGGWND